MALPLRLPAWVPTTVGMVAVCLLAAGFAGILRAPGWWPSLPAAPAGAPGVEAAASRAEATMRRAARIVHDAKTRARVFVDRGGPPDEVALVGSEITPFVTTLGSLEAKRLAASPAWARVLTRQLATSGVGEDTVVAAAFSGSFPGLNLAVVCASQALGARLIAVSSVTASTFGATDPGFTWPEIEARLADAGVIRPASVAVSVGGDGDRGLDLDEEARTAAEAIADAAAARLGAERLRPASSAGGVKRRIDVFAERAGGRRIAVFVNVGGTEAALGRSEAVLRLRSGWLAADSRGDAGDGLVGHYARGGAAVLHLLNIRDLAARWGVR